MKRMGKVTVVLVCAIFVLSVASAKAIDLETVRFHLECGCLEQLLTGDTTDLGKAARSIISLQVLSQLLICPLSARDQAPTFPARIIESSIVTVMTGRCSSGLFTAGKH